MIRYRLRCAEGHELEAWFRSSADFDAQSARGLVVCTTCGSTAVEKAIMAPSVAKRAEPLPAPVPKPPEPSVPVAAGIPPEMLEALRKIREHVKANAENVGDRFPEEARRIHYEEAEPRGIYGAATPAEARELLEEGIEVHPLPLLPEDGN